MYKQIMNSVTVPTEHACGHDTEDKVVVAVKLAEITQNHNMKKTREKGQFVNNDVFLPAGGAGGSLNQAERLTQGLHLQTDASRTQSRVAGACACARVYREQQNT